MDSHQNMTYYNTKHEQKKDVLSEQKKTASTRKSCEDNIPATNPFAVLLLHHTARHSLVATIAAIVLTALIVVLVVAIAVSLVLEQAARNRRLTEVVRIDTFALSKQSFM